MISPKMDADWNPEYKVLPSFEITEKSVTVKNIRDFKYSKGKVDSEGYVNKTYNLDKLEKVWFIFEPFSTFKPIAHTYLVFDFEGEEPIAINAEARREVGEDFSTSDLFWSNVNKYELIYVWGTEKDVTGMRAIYDTEPLYMYPLEIKKEDAQKLFLEFAKNSKELETTPVFYNLILRSCNNELAYTANKIWPGIIPNHYSIYAPGYSAEYLYKLGFISNEKPFKELTEKSYVTEFYLENYDKPDFSKKLREYLKSQ